jgi:lipopolysaccharide transport protein LptA
MTGTGQKISAVAAAVALLVGLMFALHLSPCYAQDEPEPEASPLQQPEATPTDFTPITAGDAERGGPAASPQSTAPPASQTTPAAEVSPEEIASPAAAPSAAAVPSSRAAAAPSPKHSGRRAEEKGDITRQSSKSPSGPQTVPENSPFGSFGNQKGPIDITSDKGTLDYQHKAFLYTGHVHAVQGGGDLTSDTLRVQYGQDFNDIKMIYADGNVRMSQGTRWITSDHAVLDQSKHILRFLGNPVVHDGQDQITGSVIAVDLVSGKSTVEKPRMVIFPKESKNPDNVSSPDSP